MYIIDLGGILPKNLQDKWITFQMLFDLLELDRIFSVSQRLPGDYLLFFLDGKNQTVLFNYIDPYRNSIWTIRKTNFIFCNNKLTFHHRNRQRRRRRRIWERHKIKVKQIDFKSAKKFIEYLELF